MGQHRPAASSSAVLEAKGIQKTKTPADLVPFPYKTHPISFFRLPQTQQDRKGEHGQRFLMTKTLHSDREWTWIFHGSPE